MIMALKKKNIDSVLPLSKIMTKSKINQDQIKASKITNSISIIAPSFKIPESDLNNCLSSLDDLKILYSLQTPLFKNDELCSHTAKKRFNDFKKSLKDKHDFIWCLRGGYGALQMAPEILRLTKPKIQKKLIGFSDITILHYILNQQWNWPTLHWKHLNGFLDSETKVFNGDLFVQSLDLINKRVDFEFDGLIPLNEKAEKIKILKSKIIGGNLITLQSLIGLKVKKPKGKILFFEEIDEPVYKIDRALTQLKYAGWFDGIKGILLGSFTNKNMDVEKQTQDYFETKFLDLNIPVFKGLKAGHIPDQQPLFFNTDSEIQRVKNGFSLKNKNGFLKGNLK